MFSAFCHDRCSLSLSFFLLSIVPCLPLGSQHSKAKHLGVLVLFWAMHHSPLGCTPCARLRTKQGKEQDCETIPLLHIPRTRRARCNLHWLFIFPSTPFLPFGFAFVDIGLLLRKIPPTFARKKGGSKNIILNPLCILPETLSVLSVLFVFFVSHC